MEKLSQKDNMLLGYPLQRSFTNPTPSPRGSSENSDIDFHDVFGGPPRRRSSNNETRYSFTETMDSFSVKRDNETPAPASRGSPWNEKPVFGEESVYGKRHSNDGFFDDIFKGDESITSSPRKHDRDFFSSIPGSRVMSPSRPLPPAAEPFGSSFLPAQLSLPSRLAKGTDLPAFGLTTSSTYKQRDSASNGSHTNSPKITLSRFSSISSSQGHGQGLEDLKSEYNASYHTGLLSSEFHLSSEETPSFIRSDNTSRRNNLTKELDKLDDPTRGSQIPFHFSIYKWASKGVPLMMPLRGGNGLRSKEKTLLQRSSSAKETMVKEKNERQSPTSTIHNIDFPSLFHETENTNIFRGEGDREGNDVLSDIGIDDQRNQHQIIEETISAPPSENKSNQSSLDDVGFDTIKHQTSENLKPHSLIENDLSEKVETKMTPLTKEAKKIDSKTFSSFLSDNDGTQSEKIFGKNSKEKIRAKGDKKSSRTSHFSPSSKKREKDTSPKNSKAEKASFPSSDVDSGHNIGRKNVGGKVSAFVKIFNQEPASQPQHIVDLENHGTKRKQKETKKADIEVTVDKINMEEKPKLNNIDAFIKVVHLEKIDNLKQVDDHSAIKTASYMSSSTSEQDSFASNSVHMPDGPKYTIQDVDEHFQENFLIKELPEDYDDPKETDNGLEEFKVIDDKIRQWSKGKEGNIRSLLSTLQNVLWPGSGWKPVPLVDIIEGNAVKRSYQKTLLYLHPDKLQQKGASSSQKYIAEKVFDILQEAWTHFNTLGAL